MNAHAVFRSASKQASRPRLMQYVLTVKQLGSWAQPKLLGLEAAFRRRTWRPLSSRGNFDHLLAGAGPDIYYAAVDFVDRPRSPCIMP